MSKSKGLATSLAVISVIIALIIGGVIGYFASPAKIVEKPVPTLSGEIPIGIVLPLTGGLATYAENEKVTLEKGLEEINSLLKQTGAPLTIKLLIEDSETKPDVALEKLKSLAAKGVKVVIGMMSSGEVRNVKGYADANKILIISPSSTAPALAIPDDYIFRFCPDDTKQGPAMAKTIRVSGVEYIIPVWRGDAWGDGLVDATSKRFKELGGTILEGIRYAPEAKEFSAEVKVLASRVDEAVKKWGGEKVGVYLVAFEEAVTLLTQANDYPILSKVRWFGSDGTALSDRLEKDPTASKFSVATKFVNTYFAPAESDKLMKLRDYVEKRLGRKPDPYAYNAYDALWVVVQSILIAGKYDAEAIKAVLPTVAGNTFGASGWIKLNQAGDRETADYDLWAIIMKDGTPKWEKVGYYSATTDSVTWLVKY
ncbi:MAG: ABC transporter substrate-binding protein [Nitrososphaerales archaeon]